ncbi:MAG: hypothetical protein N3A01_02510 [Bacteroidales bacterium]|nr:hypothetical protein [Bacteroidales bacterium]
MKLFLFSWWLIFKKNFCLLIFYFCLTLIPCFADTDSILYYSYLDTNNLYLEIKKKWKFNNYIQEFYYTLYSLNYYQVAKNIKTISLKIKHLEKYKRTSMYKKELENILFWKLWFYSNTNDTNNSKQLFLKIYKDKNISLKTKIKALNILGYKYAFEDPIKASNFLFEAIKLGLKDSIAELYHTYLNLSGLYLSFNLINEAEKSLKNGLKFKSKNYNPILDYLYYHNYAIVKLAQNNYDSAIVLFKKVYEFSKKYNIIEYIAGSMINLARQYFYKNNLDSVKFYLFSNTNLLRETENLSPHFRVRYYWLLGDFYNSVNKLDSSLYYLRKAIIDSKNNKMVDALPWLYYDYSKIYKSLNNIDSAYHYVDIAYQHEIDLINKISFSFATESSKKIQLLENTIKLKEAEVALLMQEKKIKKLKEFYATFIIISLLLTIIIILVIRIRFLHNLKKVKENFAQDLIRIQEKTLMSVSSELHDNIAHNLILILNNNLVKETPLLYEKINRLLDEIRDMSHNLFPKHLINLSFSEALKQLINRIEVNTKFTFIIDLDENITINDINNKLTLYRACQELINNSLKYCNGNLIYISLKKSNEYISLVYKDINNIEVNKIIKKGFGLNLIEHRVQMMNGKFKFFYKNGFNAYIKFKEQ